MPDQNPAQRPASDPSNPPAPISPLAASLAARAVFFGFATSIAGWILAYILRLPGEFVPPAVIGLTLLAAQFLGAYAAGRAAGSSKPWMVGLAAGLVTSALNTLIVLSAFAGDTPEHGGGLEPLRAIVAYIPLGAALGAIAGAIGGRNKIKSDVEPNWIGHFAVLNTAGAFALLVVGGIVTSAGAGLAVPDWPASFGANMFLFPLSRMTGGVFIEHAHRLLAVLVALNTAALLVWSLVARTPTLARIVIAIASLMVIVQAVLGGIRVVEAAAVFGLIHGVLGQIYVATLAVAAATLSRTWRANVAPTPSPAAGGQRTLNLIALIALIVQIGFGAAVRHFDLQAHALWSHVGWSVAVLILLIAAGVRGQKLLGHAGAALRRSAVAVRHTVILQMVLGVVALIAAIVFRDAETPPPLSIILRTPHQAIGSVLLIATALLTAWTLRQTTPAHAAGS